MGRWHAVRGWGHTMSKMQRRFGTMQRVAALEAERSRLIQRRKELEGTVLGQDTFLRNSTRICRGWRPWWASVGALGLPPRLSCQKYQRSEWSRPYTRCAGGVGYDVNLFPPATRHRSAGTTSSGNRVEV